jgi:hypothetical protein
LLPAVYELIRTQIVPDGAFGVLQCPADPGFALFTLERTWDAADRARLVTIPPGRYTCRRSYFHGGGYDTYEITGIPGHDRLLFHVLNLESESRGCVGLGRRRGQLDGHPAILESAIAFETFMQHTAGRTSFLLSVREAASWV